MADVPSLNTTRVSISIFVSQSESGTAIYNLTVHYLLFYEAGDRYEERRKPFRGAHLQHARAAAARGELVLGGAFANPVDGAVVCEKRSLRGEALVRSA